MKKFFSKGNALNVIIFGAIVIMAVVKTIINNGQLKEISIILSILILLLSIINLIVSVLENVNDKQTKNLSFVEENIDFKDLCEAFDSDDINYNKIQKFSRNEFYEKFMNSSSSDWVNNQIISYWGISSSRKIIRIIRKISLFIYYFILMIILAYLLVASDLSPYLSTVSFADLTIWSFVIILFEILLKKSLASVIFKIINKINKIDYIYEE